MLDLADAHGFVGEIFSDNFTPDELQNFCLTKDQINCFNDNGYVSGVKILSEDQVDISGMSDQPSTLERWEDLRFWLYSHLQFRQSVCGSESYRKINLHLPETRWIGRGEPQAGQA